MKTLRLLLFVSAALAGTATRAGAPLSTDVPPAAGRPSNDRAAPARQAQDQRQEAAAGDRARGLDGTWIFNANRLRFEVEGPNFKAYVAGAHGDRLAMHGTRDGRLATGAYLDQSWSRVCHAGRAATWDEWPFTGEADPSWQNIVLQVQKPVVALAVDKLNKTSCAVTGSRLSTWRLTRATGTPQSQRPAN